mmetsp:Transcript_26215/g.75618  ORF Transcript_26215/g.75618 Transcript_26215/m.75618 type:complete len:122 (-) Transcript_26215:373-738(-)
MFCKATIAAALVLALAPHGVAGAETAAGPGGQFQVYYFEKAASDDVAGVARLLSDNDTTDDSDENMTTTESRNMTQEASSTETASTTEASTTRTGATSGSERMASTWVAACSAVVLSRSLL